MKLYLVFISIGVLAFSTTSWADPICQSIPLNDIQYTKMLAKEGNADAQYMMGVFYDHRIDKGFYPMNEKAFSWFSKAAKQGHIKSLGALCDEYGFMDVNDVSDLDTTDGLKKCQAAAAHGHGSSQAWLGSFYRKGSGGLPQDYEKAYYWYLLSGKVHNPVPKRVRNDLTEEQITKVEKLAAEFKAQAPAETERYNNNWEEEGLHRYRKNLIPLNIRGLICGGTAKDCYVVDKCQGYIGIVCPRIHDQKYLIVDSTAAKVISECKGHGDCEDLVPTSWECASPKNMPLSKKGREKFPEYKNAVRCGDVLGVDRNSAGDGPYSFISTRTGQEIGSCSFWQGKCEPPKEWTCGRPSNYGG